MNEDSVRNSPYLVPDERWWHSCGNARASAYHLKYGLRRSFEVMRQVPPYHIYCLVVQLPWGGIDDGRCSIIVAGVQASCCVTHQYMLYNHRCMLKVDNIV